MGRSDRWSAIAFVMMGLGFWGLSTGCGKTVLKGNLQGDAVVAVSQGSVEVDPIGADSMAAKVIKGDEDFSGIILGCEAMESDLIECSLVSSDSKPLDQETLKGLDPSVRLQTKDKKPVRSGEVTIGGKNGAGVIVIGVEEKVDVVVVLVTTNKADEELSAEVVMPPANDENDDNSDSADGKMNGENCDKPVVVELASDSLKWPDQMHLDFYVMSPDCPGVLKDSALTVVFDVSPLWGIADAESYEISDRDSGMILESDSILAGGFSDLPEFRGFSKKPAFRFEGGSGNYILRIKLANMLPDFANMTEADLSGDVYFQAATSDMLKAKIKLDPGDEAGKVCKEDRLPEIALLTEALRPGEQGMEALIWEIRHFGCLKNLRGRAPDLTLQLPSSLSVIDNSMTFVVSKEADGSAPYETGILQGMALEGGKMQFKGPASFTTDGLPDTLYLVMAPAQGMNLNPILYNKTHASLSTLMVLGEGIMLAGDVAILTDLCQVAGQTRARLISPALFANDGGADSSHSSYIKSPVDLSWEVAALDCEGQPVDLKRVNLGFDEKVLYDLQPDYGHTYQILSPFDGSVILSGGMHFHCHVPDLYNNANEKRNTFHTNEKDLALPAGMSSFIFVFKSDKVKFKKEIQNFEEVTAVIRLKNAEATSEKLKTGF